MGDSGIPQPDVSGLPIEAPQSELNLQNASQAMTPQVQPPVTGNKSAIKGLLTNFFQGFGGAMMHEAGLKTPEEQQQEQQKLATQQQLAQSTIQYHQALAKNLNDQNELVPIQQGADANGNPQEPLYVARRSQGQLLAKQMGINANPNLKMTTIGPEHVAVNPQLAPLLGKQYPSLLLDRSVLGTAGAQNKAANAPEKTPTEIRLRMLSDEGDPQATRILAKMQADKIALQKERGVGYAQGRALYTPFETVIPGTNIPTTISNMQALKTGAPKISMASQQKLGGQYALFNDAYGILDRVDQLADKVNLDNPGVSSRVAAGYAAIKDPAAKGLTGEILSNAFARQPIYNTLTPDERDLVLTMAQGKAAGTGLRQILGQAGTNEMQQRLDSALFPGGQTAASTAGLKQQTEATRQLLDRFIVGQPEAGLNAPGASSALRTRRGGGTTAPSTGKRQAYRVGNKWYDASTHQEIK